MKNTLFALFLLLISCGSSVSTEVIVIDKGTSTCGNFIRFKLINENRVYETNECSHPELSDQSYNRYEQNMNPFYDYYVGEITHLNLSKKAFHKDIDGWIKDYEQKY